MSNVVSFPDGIQITIFAASETGILCELSPKAWIELSNSAAGPVAKAAEWEFFPVEPEPRKSGPVLVPEPQDFSSRPR